MYPNNELLKYPSWDTKYLHSTHPEILTLIEPLGGNIPPGVSHKMTVNIQEAPRLPLTLNSSTHTQNHPCKGVIYVAYPYGGVGAYIPDVFRPHP